MVDLKNFIGASESFDELIEAFSISEAMEFETHRKQPLLDAAAA